MSLLARRSDPQASRRSVREGGRGTGRVDSGTEVVKLLLEPRLERPDVVQQRSLCGIVPRLKADGVAFAGPDQPLKPGMAFGTHADPV